MRKVIKVTILLIVMFLLSSCGKKSYVVFDYNCNGREYHKCELKNNKLNCYVETPTCGEYKFKGWYKANEYENQVDLRGTFSEDEIIYARWEKVVEGSSSSQIEEPSSIVLESSSQEEPSSQVIDEPSSQKPTPTPEATYTISFNANGGSGGQSQSISGIKYGADLPSINQTKPTKSGYTFMGWYDNQTGGTQYYNSSNSPVRKYDKKNNITLYAQWRVNVLSIQYNGNGGTWISKNSNYGVNSSGTVIEKSTGKIYSKQINYGSNTESSGLTDYNGSWFKWKKDGYTAESKKEYFLQNGSIKNTLDQAKVYSAADLAKYSGCDLSKKDCTIIVKVNWKENPLASSGLGRDIVATNELKTACYWVINQELVKIRLQTCNEETGRRYSNANEELPGGSYVTSDGKSDVAKETIPFSQYSNGVFYGEEKIDIASDSRYAFMIMYRTVFLKNTVHYAINAKRDPVVAGEEIRARAGSCFQNYRNTYKKSLYDSGKWNKEIDDTNKTTKYLILANQNGEVTRATYHSDDYSKKNCKEKNRECGGIEGQIEKAGAEGTDYIKILEEVIKKGNFDSPSYKTAKVYDCRNLLETGDIEYVVK